MKKSLLFTIMMISFGIYQLQAQSGYNTAIGIGLDLGDGPEFVGPSAKHFFTENHAGQAEVLFGDEVTIISVFYLYH